MFTLLDDESDDPAASNVGLADVAAALLQVFPCGHSKLGDNMIGNGAREICRECQNRARKNQERMARLEKARAK